MKSTISLGVRFQEGKICGDAGLLQGRMSASGMIPADETVTSLMPLVVEEFHQLGADGVCARRKRIERADYVDVFLHGGGGDHLRGFGASRCR